jgi:hypothetical protein
MAQLTKRHRAIIERHLNRTKQREGHMIMVTTHKRVRPTYRILDRTSQATKYEPESDSKKSDT